MTSENRKQHKGLHTKLGMHNRRAIILFSCVFPFIERIILGGCIGRRHQDIASSKVQKVAMEEGLQYEDSIVSPSAAPNPLPFPDIPIVEKGKRLPPIYREGDRVRAPRAYLPYDLSMQPLEGNPEDISAVGEALRKAEQGQRIRMTFLVPLILVETIGLVTYVVFYRPAMEILVMVLRCLFLCIDQLRANDINLCSTSGWVKDYVGYQDGHDDEYLAFGMSVSSDDPEEFAWLETTHQNQLAKCYL